MTQPGAVFGDHPLLRAGSPFEIVETERGPGFRSGPHSLQEVYRRARRMGDKVLLVSGDRRLTYGEAFSTADRLANRLIRAHGIVPGDSVVLALPNGAAWVIWFLALTLVGARVVLADGGPLAPSAGVIKGSWLVTEPEGAGDGDARWLPGDLAAPGVLEDEPPWIGTDLDPDAPAVVLFTSGSSGRPKGVAHSQRSLLSGLRNGMLAAALLAGRRERPTAPARPAAPCVLLLAPLSYVSGLSALILALMTFGRLVVAAPSQGAAGLAQLIQQEGVRSIAGAPPGLLLDLLSTPGASEALASLAGLQLHGAAITPALVRTIRQALPNVAVSSSYGLTETAGALAGADVESLLERPGAAGLVLPSVALKIVTASGETAPPGEPGAILVRGAMVMLGYLAEDGLARTDDWHATGDVGHVDDEGYLHVARDQGLVSAGDEWVAPESVAVIARTFDFVADVAAFRAGDERPWIGLAVERRAGHETCLAQLADAVRERYPLGDRLVAIAFDKMPRRASGKADLQAIRRALDAQQLHP